MPDDLRMQRLLDELIDSDATPEEVCGSCPELLPQVRRVGILFDRSDTSSLSESDAAKSMHGKLGLEVIFAEASTPAAIEPAVKLLVKGRADVLAPTASTMYFHQRKRLIALCTQHKLPVFAWVKEWTEDGALASYGSTLDEQLRRSAHLMDKVLRGTKPADIPVEQPTRFEFVLNMKTAKALGLKIPQSMLLRADRVIE